MKAPIWSRLLYRFSRALNVVDVTQQIVRDELLFAFLRPDERAALTFAAYAKSSSYGPGGEIFTRGLFSWESALLSDSRIPPSGRVLLAAGGGGRELKALLERGYEVCAFEPVAPFFENLRAIARGANAVVVRAAYEDVVARAEGRSGALDAWRGDFDFCVLGWGSLSHLTEPSEVLRVLGALRAFSPRAPVIASFLSRSPGPLPTAGGARRLRRVLRDAFEAAGGRRVHPGMQFLTSAGFMYSFSREELVGLCDQVGYEVAIFDDSFYPHALLVPRERARSETTSDG